MTDMFVKDAKHIREAIECFQKAIAPQNLDRLDRLGVLATALDGLVGAYNAAPICEPDDGNDAPYIAIRPLGEVFPTLGYYADVEPTSDLSQQLAVADAIDDLQDIDRDLRDVIWYFDEGRPGTGIWEFRFGYQTHWGEHLHSLRRHLHTLLN